jgi:hypothetical protein
MDGWKKTLVVGSIGAAGILFMKKKYPAGVLATGVGLALLAAEYPEKFEKVRRSLPDYFEHGMRVMEMAAQAGKRITEAAGRSAVGAWEEFGGSGELDFGPQTSACDLRLLRRISKV